MLVRCVHGQHPDRQSSSRSDRTDMRLLGETELPSRLLRLLLRDARCALAVDMVATLCLPTEPFSFVNVYCELIWSSFCKVASCDLWLGSSSRALRGCELGDCIGASDLAFSGEGQACPGTTRVTVRYTPGHKLSRPR